MLAGSLATWPIQHRFQEKPRTPFGGSQEGEATCVYLTATYLKDKSPQSKPPTTDMKVILSTSIQLAQPTSDSSHFQSIQSI